MVTPKQFWTMCRLHDWFFSMSEDPEVYRDGRDNLEMLERIAAKNPELYAVYDAWRAYNYEAGAPRPTEPKEE